MNYTVEVKKTINLRDVVERMDWFQLNELIELCEAQKRHIPAHPEYGFVFDPKKADPNRSCDACGTTHIGLLRTQGKTILCTKCLNYYHL